MTNQHATITFSLTSDHPRETTTRLLHELLDEASAAGVFTQRGIYPQEDPHVRVQVEPSALLVGPLEVEVEGGVLVGVRTGDGRTLQEGADYRLRDHDLQSVGEPSAEGEPGRRRAKGVRRLSLKARAREIDVVKHGTCPACPSRLDARAVRSNVAFRQYRCPTDETHFTTVIRAALVDNRGGTPLDIAVMEAREEAECPTCNAKLIAACVSPRQKPPLRRPHPERVQAAHEYRMWLVDAQTLRPYTPPVHGVSGRDLGPASIEKVFRAGLEAATATWLINADLDGNPVTSRRAATALMSERIIVLCLREADPLHAGTPLYAVTQTHMEAALAAVAQRHGLPLSAFQAGCEEDLADEVLQYALFGSKVFR